MKQGLQIILITIALTGIFQFIHEAGHVVVATIYGSNPVWGFSSVIQKWDEVPETPSDWEALTLPPGASGWVKLKPPESDLEQVLFDGMGPVFSLSAFLLFLAASYFATSDKRRKLLLLGVFSLGFSLGFYYLRAHSSYWGDEKSLAHTLGVSIYLFNIPLMIIYFAGLIYAIVNLYKLNFGMRQILLVVITTIGTGIAMNRSQFIVTQQVDAGNSLFDPVFGFSTPVFGFFGLCFLIFALFWGRASRAGAS